jgi:CRISPR-associated protein Cmr2
MPTGSDKQALLSFMIGQPQAFIEAARTVRDLWTGSYLMSWLTAAAIWPVIKECGYGAFITPYVGEDNPMLRAMRDGPTGDDRATLPSLPNKFAAQVPLGKAEALRESCLRACREEWARICKAVHDRLEGEFRRHDPHWDRFWDDQVTTFFEMRCVVQPLATVDDNSREWVNEFDQLGALLEMTRSVRHVPNYHPRSDNGRYPAKCSLLGTLEQMGPAEFDRSREFWKAVSEEWPGLYGTRLRLSDRLCAVSLVKRFAWPAYFAASKSGRGRLGVWFDELRYSDTATLTAALWLPDPAELPSEADDSEERGTLDWRRLRRWSGQWLHWTKRDQDKDERPCPPSVWDRIQAHKRAKGQPPRYYAILLLDGDRMGDMFRGELQPHEQDWREGRRRYQRITEGLTQFSLKVRGIIQGHGGELIYAGGDDVLAFLPTATVIACAKEVREAFRADDCLTCSASISGGIAVVHHKEDLRFALHQAREAERAAKRIDRTDAEKKTKDALALRVCRRSGEHTMAVFGWGQAESLTGLVDDFLAGASDRWAYKLRGALPTLGALGLTAGRAEINRLLARVESPPPGFADRVRALFDQYRDEMTRPGRGWGGEETLDGFVTLCQAASFLARGRD